MAATLGFYAGSDFAIQSLSGSGLGFYGSSFGQSIEVGAFNSKTYITNGAGTSLGPEADNIKFLNSASGIVGSSGSGISLRSIPNYQATLNIRFSYDTPVQVQNAEVRIYDRYNVNNPPSGVTAKLCELIHVGTTQINTGSGSNAWVQAEGSGVVLDLYDSPGVSGIYNNTTSTWTDTVHDWYVGISCSPNSIGSKTQFGLFCQLEYL